MNKRWRFYLSLVYEPLSRSSRNFVSAVVSFAGGAACNEITLPAIDILSELIRPEVSRPLLYAVPGLMDALVSTQHWGHTSPCGGRCRRTRRGETTCGQ